jgi:leader peptidase (prepilin peptidase) / N-methyltransferase
MAAFGPSATHARRSLDTRPRAHRRTVSFDVARYRRRMRALRTRDVAAGVVAGLLAACALAVFGVNARGVVGAVFAAVLVVLSAIDLERRIIPNRIVLPATLAVLLIQAAFSPERTVEAVVAALAAALVLYLPLVLYPAGMGMGDVKLALLLGAALGKSVVVALVVGLVAPLPVAILVLLLRGPGARKTAIPFGPFLALGGLVALFFGDGLLAAYAAL